MSALEWFLSNLALPLSAVAMVAMLLTWPRNLLMPITGWLVMRRVRAEEEELRSRPARGGSEDAAGTGTPSELPAARVGVERFPFSAPPAPHALVGAVDPHTAPASHQPIAVMGERACGYSWGSGCPMNGGGAHSCSWPKSQCVSHLCPCGAR